MSRRSAILAVTGHLPALICFEEMDRSSLCVWIDFLSQRQRRREYRTAIMEVLTYRIASDRKLEMSVNV